MTLLYIGGKPCFSTARGRSRGAQPGWGASGSPLPSTAASAPSRHAFPRPAPQGAGPARSPGGSPQRAPGPELAPNRTEESHREARREVKIEVAFAVLEATEARSYSRGNSGEAGPLSRPGRRQPPRRGEIHAAPRPPRTVPQAEPANPGSPPQSEQRGRSRLPQPAPPAGPPVAAKFPRGRAEAGGDPLPGPAASRGPRATRYL